MIHVLERMIREEVSKGFTIEQIKSNPSNVLKRYREIRDKGRLSLTNSIK